MVSCRNKHFGDILDSVWHNIWSADFCINSIKLLVTQGIALSYSFNRYASDICQDTVWKSVL